MISPTKTRLLLPLLTLGLSLVALPLADNSAQTPQAGKEPAYTSWKASGKRGAIAAGGEEAVSAGMTILKSGGNAIDAAVATIFALSVTDSTLFCFGGEVPIMVYDAKRGVTEVLCGLGTAPKLATREYFAKMGGIPGKGILPAAIPGMVDACLTALDRYGTKTFGQCSAPTLQLLDKGNKSWHPLLAATIRRMIDAERASDGDRKRGLRLVADYFYRGPIAREIDAWSKANGGLIRYTDLATHVTRIDDPVHANYRGHTVYKCNVWTQGAYLLETLRLLDGFNIRAMGHNQPDTIHTAVEALKLGLADRDFYFADPLFADVPIRALLSNKYADIRRPLIDLKSASLVQRPGDPKSGQALHPNPNLRVGPGGPSNDTTTCVVADDHGNVVAATPSGFSGAQIGKTGIWLGSRLQSFNIWEGHANCIEPGKRPRITLTPGLVFKDGKPLLAISVAGGDQQDQAALQLIINNLDFGLSPAEAVSAPRFGTDHLLGSFRQKAPVLGSLYLTSDFSRDAVNELKSRGHIISIKKASNGANPVMLRIDPQTRVIEAAGDPKSRRHAAAW